MAVRDACRASGVPFFFKQWGGVRKGKSGRLLQGQTCDEVPPRPIRPMPTLKERRAVIAEFETNDIK